MVLLIIGVQTLFQTSSLINKEGCTLHSFNHDEKTEAQNWKSIQHITSTQISLTNGLSSCSEFPPLYYHGYNIKRTILVSCHNCYYIPSWIYHSCTHTSLFANSWVWIHSPFSLTHRADHPNDALSQPTEASTKTKAKYLHNNPYGLTLIPNQGWALFPINSLEDFQGLYIWTGAWWPRG